MTNTANRILVLSLLIFSCSPYENITQISTMNELDYPFEVKKATLQNDVEIAYTDQGSGNKVLLFVHGLGSYAPAWLKNVESLKKQYRCIAVDLPGYGKSSKGNYSGSMTFYADILKEFVEQLGLSKVNLVGHSMGGQISIVTSLFHPEIVDQLILIAPAGFEVFDEGEKDWFRSIFTPLAVKNTSAEQVKLNYAYNFYKMPKEAEFMITDRLSMRYASDFDGYCYIIPQCVQGMVDEPVFDELKKLQQETLIIFGEHDLLIPNRYLNGGRTKTIAEAGHTQIPNSKLHLIDDAGHFVMFEQSEKVNSLISDFIR